MLKDIFLVNRSPRIFLFLSEKMPKVGASSDVIFRVCSVACGCQFVHTKHGPPMSVTNLRNYYANSDNNKSVPERGRCSTPIQLRQDPNFFPPSSLFPLSLLSLANLVSFTSAFQPFKIIRPTKSLWSSLPDLLASYASQYLGLMKVCTSSISINSCP
jgi:hypothetical protein